MIEEYEQHNALIPYLLSCVYDVVFNNRHDAGLLLSDKLNSHLDRLSVVVGIARGGVVVAWAIAHKLSLPLSTVVVKKISSPTNPELAVGAVAPEGVSFVDIDLAGEVGADTDYIAKQIDMLRRSVNRRQGQLLETHAGENLQGKTIILVDDGIATGATVKAAVLWLRKQNVRAIILATPVIARDSERSIRLVVDELVALDVQEKFSSVGAFYRAFEQVEDREVIELLKKRQ